MNQPSNQIIHQVIPNSKMADESTRLVGRSENVVPPKQKSKSKWKTIKKAVKIEAKNNRIRQNTRNSMIMVGQIKGVGKPIKKWYRGLVIRQCCHSHLASKYLYQDMCMNTFSVALTAITSSAIFTSLSPSSSSSSQPVNYNYDQVMEDGVADGEGDTVAFVNPTAQTTPVVHIPVDYASTLALLAGIIAAFNTVLQGISRTQGYGQRGEQHLHAYKNFSRLRFKLENIIGDKPKYGDHENVDTNLLDNWIKKYEEVLEESPVRYVT